MTTRSPKLPDRLDSTVDGNPRQLPHDQVYTRLGVSQIHGVGVVAITDIPQGTEIFGADQGAILWLPLEDLDTEAIGPELAALYDDFGICREGLIGVPTHFDNLTPGWYVNEPAVGEPANVAVDETFRFVALRPILKGEELTVVYASFSEPLTGRKTRLAY